jgi:2-succinyl-6-hydroxy-2,4-cyclohexadiene-1-carboxylate synthase
MGLTWALHGFLGLPEDWQPFSEAFGRMQTPDLWSAVERVRDGDDAFASWTQSFIADVEKAGEKSLLIGYSLGGRLAMHAAIARPELFSAVVIVSAHPGLSDEKLREPRMENDRRWAMRFLGEGWAKLIGDWTSQDVFKRPLTAQAEDAIQLSRQETKFDRRALAKAMTLWSLAKQKDLRRSLEDLGTPVLFVCGRDDGKFSEVYEGLRLSDRQSRVVIEGAGHRVPWEQPRAFRREVVQFLSKYGLD